MRLGRSAKGVAVTVVILIIMGLIFHWERIESFIVLTTGYIAVGMPTPQDYSHARALCNELVSMVPTELESKSQPGRPPIFCQPPSRQLMSRPLTVTVYEIRDRETQDRLVGAAQTFRRRNNLKRIKIVFYDSESWWSEGHGVTTRKPEIVLRTVILEE